MAHKQSIAARPQRTALPRREAQELSVASSARVRQWPRFTFLDDASCREHMASHPSCHEHMASRPSCNLQGHCNPSNSPIYWSYILGRLRHWIGSHHLSNTYSGTRIRQARTPKSRVLRSQAPGTAHHGERRKGDEGRKIEPTAPEQVAVRVRSRIPWICPPQ